ncbi:hypothetical protein [Nocardia sp. NPDC056100]|uniref:hypothetical protein n=1 Tax=Nocardia sp. NPDC056100 TaxID=3345712 RepID=UPI0035DD76C0
MGLFSNDDPAVAAEKARVKAQQQADRQARQAENEKREAEAAFNASPGGQARTAHKRGDQLFQINVDLEQVSGQIVTMASVSMKPTGAHSNSRRSSPSTVLNAILAEGWSLQILSTAFIPTTQESRDKFLASGQQVAVSGRLVGTYVFSRAD